jgi:hypothetical protein
MACKYYAVKRKIEYDNVVSSFGNPMPIEIAYCMARGNAAQANRDQHFIGALTCGADVEKCEIPSGAPTDASE